MIRLALICHAPTRATRLSTFPDDEPVEPNTLDNIALPRRLHNPAHCQTSPATRALQTADALRLRATVEPVLRECNFGDWTGRSLAEIARAEPDAMAAWLADPAAAPHGGESIGELVNRAGKWFASLESLSGQVVAVTHQSFIRASLIHVLNVPPNAFWRIDVLPLAIVELTSNGRRWSVVFQSAEPPPPGTR